VSAARLGSALEKVSSVRQIDTFFGGGS